MKSGEQKTYIVVYGLTSETVSLIEDLKHDTMVIHDATGIQSDILAYTPVSLAIINPLCMDENSLKMVLDYYHEVKWYLSEYIIFTSKVNVPKISKIICLESENQLNKNKLLEVFSSILSKNRKNKRFHSQLALCLSILKKIKMHPGISTSDLAQDCEVSEKTVLRYIETLRVSGEFIDFDRAVHGWRCIEY